jgi:hypothetical protein
VRSVRHDRSTGCGRTGHAGRGPGLGVHPSLRN